MNIQLTIDFLIKIFTKDNVTFALAIFGSLGAAWNILQSRRKLSIKLSYYYETEYLFDDVEQLEQIKDLITDTYQKCKNM